MSSGNDKELRIEVTAETAGAERLGRALVGVRDAAEEVAEAGGKAEETLGAEATAMLKLAEAQAAVRDATISSTEVIAAQEEAWLAAGDAAFEAARKEGKGLEEATKASDKAERAVKEHLEALRELSAEASKPDWLQKQFAPEKLKAIKQEFGAMASAVGDFAKEFAKTEEGQRLLEKLPDGLEVFGETAAKVGGDVAKGFSEGGVIGGALAGTAALIKHLGEEYLDAQRRIEASNRELEEAQAAAAERAEERRKAATSREIERTLEGEKRLLEDQNAAIQTQTGLWNARKDLARSDLEKRRAEAELRGEDTTKFDREKIDLDFTQGMLDLKGEKDRLLGGRAQAIHEVEEKKRAVEKEAASSGRENGPARKLQEELDDAERRLEAIERDLPRQLETNQTKEQAVRNRKSTSLTQLQKRVEDDAGRRREKTGKEGEGIADDAAREFKNTPGVAKELTKMGDAIHADPTAKNLGALADAIGKFTASYAQRDKEKASALTKLQEQVRKLQGEATKGAGVSHNR